MTEQKSRLLFEKYNPKESIKCCPNGRAKMRKPLDHFARAAVNLYGIIGCKELVDIWNDQNEDKTTVEELHILLLPLILKDEWYCFYKGYLAHYAIFHDFEYVDYLLREQGDKPRYIPQKDEFLRYEWEAYEDGDHWDRFRDYMFDIFGMNPNTRLGFREMMDYLKSSFGIDEIGEIMERYNLTLKEKHAQKFFDLLMQAKNSTRIWENKGYSPNELIKLMPTPSPGSAIEVYVPINIEPNEPCPCVCIKNGL